jgi:hypothetical protein
MELQAGQGIMISMRASETQGRQLLSISTSGQMRLVISPRWLLVRAIALAIAAAVAS